MEADPPNLNELLQQDFNKAHEDFDLVYYFIGFILIMLVLWAAGIIGGEKPKVVDEDEKLRETPYTLD